MAGKSFDTCEGRHLVSCSLLRRYSEEVVADGLSDEGVTRLHRISKRNAQGDLETTATLFQLSASLSLLLGFSSGQDFMNVFGLTSLCINGSIIARDMDI